MTSGHALVALGGAFIAAAVLARMGRRIGLPTIPFFMLAGVLFGPDTPGLVLVDDPEDLEILASLGLVLLLFYLGLEFSISDLTGGGRRLVASGTSYLVLNVGGGLAFGAALGWGGAETLVIGGAMGISSSAIVTKLLVELRRLANPETRSILGIIVVEDLFLAVYLAMLQPVLGGAEGVGETLASFGRAFGFLAGMAIVARWGSRLVAKLAVVDDDELLTVTFVGLAVLVAGFAEQMGVSDAIGAFMVGLVLAESPARGRIEQLVLPLRDAFAALFFFTFGLVIDPGEVAAVIGPILAAVAVSVVLNVAAGVVAARIHGYDATRASNIGLTVLSRGEFSLILASLAAAAGLDARIGPFVAGYVLILAILGPVLAARSQFFIRVVRARRARVRAANPERDEHPEQGGSAGVVSTSQ